ncbi:hypothetical protein CONLIGDRAFT_647555 [Coniochaeta ligniaria NRRL 30616]|uniref:Chromo domain-containing protein n=1 Tax=Coniochaeta ligniaria NRRL 30616 TaxID=1408157 RepID=A0A1J7IXM8_9PEZI|nr:hypothetical protein CONLIGDRAFT_647555 [Coniochaeta ligniaria NRRL 30616]
MFKSVPRKGSSDLRSPVMPTVASPEELDDDNISLTSTLPDEHDPEEEFAVKTIHMENVAEDGGEMLYLVEWEDYPLDRCTWEPASNIGEELLQIWEQKKEAQGKGQEEAWTWDKWIEIGNTAAEEHEARHRRRNARRKRLGLPLTEPVDEDESRSSYEDDGSSVEAEEDRPLAAISTERRRSQTQQKTGTTTGVSSSLSTPSQPRRQNSQPDSRSRPGLTRKVSKDSGPPSRLERPSSTGYQGTARRPSLSTSSSNRGILPAPGKPAVAKRFTAKKSAPVPGTSNVFAGGKIRKARVGFKDAMSDPTKEPKLFTRHRYRRLAEKYSRDKEDRPPPVLPNLFINLDAPSRRKLSVAEPSSATSEQKHPPLSATTVTDTPLRKKSTMTEPASTTSEMLNHIPSPIVRNATLPNKPKKKKSVRFHEDDTMFVEESTPMEIDSPTTGGSEEQHIPTPQADIPTRTVQTKLWFGFIHDSEPVLASVDRVPLTSEDPWLSEFLKAEILRMEYACSVKDFAFQKQNLWQHLLCSGTLSSETSGPIFETVAAYLREGMLALYHTSPSYSLLIYPTSCDEWRSFMAELGVPPSDGAESSLKYCIFRSPEDCGPFLRRPAAKVPEKNFGSYEEKLLWRLFRFDYQALLPPSKPGSNDSLHHCFLLFPRNRHDWVAALARWIHLCSPKCQIYSSYDSGSWSSFCDAVGSGGGIVIVHELLALSLRRITDLWNRLHNYRDSYWCLSEAIQPQPVFPSLTLPDDFARPGEIRFTPLFPARPKRRVVLFLTPSFLSSEPRQVFELLQWFYDVWVLRRSPTCRLVTAYNLHEYLEELALVKSRERERLLNLHKHDVPQAEMLAKSRGLNSDDCAYRFKAWSLALELHHLRARDAGPSDVNEDLSSLQYADASIDPNDEQSLVNWFGWWSSMRLDQFRGFHVVGSASTMKFNGSKKGSRIIRIPKYSRCTLNDPDLVREEVQRINEPTEPSKDLAQSDVQESISSASLTGPSAGPSRPWVFQSRHVTSERASAFTHELQQMKDGGPLKVYVFPVSWMDIEQSFHFGDVREEFTRLERWWTFAYPFSPSRPFNTFLAFFYTLSEDWNPEAPPASKTPVRHPWICVYRTVGGVRARPSGPCELLIWDPAARDRFPGEQAPRENELAYGQRRTIEYVREKTGDKNPGSWLSHVWYGGFERPPNVDSPHHIDIALASLDMMTRDPFTNLPLPHSVLAHLGYRKVRPQSSALSPTKQQTSPRSEPMDIDTPEDDESSEDDEDTRIIFHPPRGERLPNGKRTRCINHLYEQATAARREAKLEGKEKTHMRYEFQVTTEWYDVQRFEGRGFEHVYVAPWESVFSLLQIASTSTSRASNAGQENTQSSSSASFDKTMKG